MTIEQLKIGEPVKLKKNPTNTWRIYTRVMHGDADKYETRTQDFLKIKKEEYDYDEKDLVYFAALLQKILKLRDNREYEELLEPTAKELNYPYDPNMEDPLCELIPGDCTADFQFKTYLRDFRITWFDENGIEHEVSIKE